MASPPPKIPAGRGGSGKSNKGKKQGGKPPIGKRGANGGAKKNKKPGRPKGSQVKPSAKPTVKNKSLAAVVTKKHCDDDEEDEDVDDHYTRKGGKKRKRESSKRIDYAMVSLVSSSILDAVDMCVNGNSRTSSDSKVSMMLIGRVITATIIITLRSIFTTACIHNFVFLCT